MKTLSIVKCPVCGQEYSAAEIYMPKSFFGEPTEIIRNPAGEIEVYLGEEADLDEEFVCEKCGAKLAIHANLSFDVTPVEEFEEESTVDLKKVKLKETDLFND